MNYFNNCLQKRDVSFTRPKLMFDLYKNSYNYSFSGVIHFMPTSL